jgi:molybdopterin molybdotransferase
LAEALGRVVAEDIEADADLVPYARSAMDGYALYSADTEGASANLPLSLPVVGAVFAGQGCGKLTPRTAMAISTGASIPIGADAVIPHESVQVGNHTIVICEPVGAGDCIFSPGEDVHRGDALARSGDVIRPGTLGLLAFAGVAQVRVFCRPRLSLVCTGNELVDVTAVRAHGQIRNSSRFTLTLEIK